MHWDTVGEVGLNKCDAAIWEDGGNFNNRREGWLWRVTRVGENEPKSTSGVMLCRDSLCRDPLQV